jgi:peptidyl-prolyl cis-trans isomerase C
MQTRSTLLLAAFVMTLIASAGAADKPVAVVNGVVISQTTADVFMAQGTASGAPDDPGAKERLREELIKRELMYQAAKQAGVDKKPVVAAELDAAVKKMRAQMDATVQTMITRAYLEDYLKTHPVTEAQLKQTYDAYRAKGGDTEYKAAHILLGSEAAAKAVIDKLNHGARFEELAQQSLDTGTRGAGGDLGWAGPAKYAEPFGQALRGLKKGTYSVRPVKTEFGYHVIRLDDARPLQVPSFETLKPMLRKDAEGRQLERMVADLHAKAKIQ